jgi:hypothetical protein
MGDHRDSPLARGFRLAAEEDSGLSGTERNDSFDKRKQRSRKSKIDKLLEAAEMAAVGLQRSSLAGMPSTSGLKSSLEPGLCLY